MTNVQAILIGAALIAGAVVANNSLQPAHASVTGPFALMRHSNTVANAGVFRIDTATGAVSYCYITGSQSLTCTGETR